MLQVEAAQGHMSRFLEHYVVFLPVTSVSVTKPMIIMIGILRKILYILLQMPGIHFRRPESTHDT
jgi:hypothetical protein